MMNKFATMAVVAVSAAGFASAALAGPKLSSETYIPGVQAGTPVSQYDPAMQGPKVSSETHIAATPFVPAVTPQPATTAQRYVLQQGYDPHGIWRSHWMAVQ